MLSSGANVIIWEKMISSGANVIIVSSGANVIIWCYHVMLSSGMITQPFLFFLKTSLTQIEDQWPNASATSWIVQEEERTTGYDHRRSYILPDAPSVLISVAFWFVNILMVLGRGEEGIIQVVSLSDGDFNWPLPITATKDNDKKQIDKSKGSMDQKKSLRRRIQGPGATQQVQGSPTLFPGRAGDKGQGA
jgi:hypothetical protein